MRAPGFASTAEIEIPKDPFERIIGQEEAVNIAKLIPVQRRHLLLVGPPGTGKSLIAQAIASLLPKPQYEISVLHNEERPERPLVELRHESLAKADVGMRKNIGTLLEPVDIPTVVAEQFGLRCRRCGALNALTEQACHYCSAGKQGYFFAGERYGIQEAGKESVWRVTAARRTPDGKQERISYEMDSEGCVRMLTQQEIRMLGGETRRSKRMVIVPLGRNLFVQANGASETELLGDVRHDPYGSHPQLGTPPFMRVVPGAIHEAHEGVLFVDELSTLGTIQRYILSAMQDKAFPIAGRNPTSSGASVRVDSVPCDFIFVGATNINDLNYIIPPLRSRIRGDGYEVLMNTSMPETAENTRKLLQFIAQEIIKDGRIPHASAKAAEELLLHARKIAREVDNASGYSLRLRAISGIIKMAGDFARLNAHGLIEREDVVSAVKGSRSAEEQLKEQYNSPWKACSADYGARVSRPGPETA